MKIFNWFGVRSYFFNQKWSPNLIFLNYDKNENIQLVFDIEAHRNLL